LLDDDGTMAQQWELGDGPLAVGRDESADVRIDDQTLSRRHFLIEREGENYLLKDLNSQNGTWVDGRRASASATRLRHHDCIVAGRTLFLFSQHRPTRKASADPLAAPADMAVLSAALQSQPTAGEIRPQR
jgi:pSer/pThr/pTyr-binding forkhead associated (FHA) protein